MSYDATYTPSVYAYIVYDIVYDIVRPTYDIVRQNTGSCQSYVRYRIRYRTFFTGSCQSYVRHRIRHRTFFDDVAYDVQGNIGIIRYRT